MRLLSPRGCITMATGLLLSSCAGSQSSPIAVHPFSNFVRQATTSNYIYATDQNHLLTYPAGVPNPSPSVTSVPTYPHGVATDAAGNVYVASAESHMVSVFGSGGKPLKYTIGTAPGKPEAVAIDSAGNVYVADPQQYQVVEYGPGPFGTTKATFTTLEEPYGGLAIDSSGNVYVDVQDGTVEECNPVCNALPSNVHGYGNTFGGIAFVPGQLAVSAGASVNYFYTSDWSSGRQGVQYDGSGGVTRFMTSDASGALYIPFNKEGVPGQVSGVAVVPYGLLPPYVITSGLVGPFGAAAGP